MVAMLIEDLLAELGYTVIGPASRVEQALDLLASEEVDGALLDVNLLGARSYPVADALLARSCPFVFVTGYGEAGLDPDYRAHPVLQKPFTRDSIERMMAAHIG